MKITLIGASGFVGTRLLDLLKNGNCKLLNIDKRQSEFHPEITAVNDILLTDNLTTLLADTDIVILLAAEHRDDVTPTSLYYDVNVGGLKKVLNAMEANGIKRIVFISSVAIYGLNRKSPNETDMADPFNHYGKSKWQAEQVMQEWYKNHTDWNVNILRPTVIFGERNRGNVYNLLKQIASGRFLMIGKGENKKSMAYVGNVVAFIDYCINEICTGYHVFNYVDKPDANMNELVSHVGNVLNKDIPSIRVPYVLGMIGGAFFDVLAKVSRKKLSVSSIRVKKFCATTQFDATKVHSCGFKAPYTLDKGLERTLRFEFLDNGARDGITYKSE